MTALRADGALVLREWIGDIDRPRGHQVRVRKAKAPHEQMLDRGAIKPGHYEAACRYLKGYELGVLGGQRAFDAPDREAPAARFHESRMHHLGDLRAAQIALRPHERAVLDSVVLAGMTLDAYACEVLRMDEQSKPTRTSTAFGLLLGALETLCDLWGISTLDSRKTNMARNT